MRIKPEYDKKYIVRFRRKKDVQVTEVVEATWEELHTLIAKTFNGRFVKPKSSDYVTATQIQVQEVDLIKKQVHILPFVYTNGKGKDFEKTHVNVYNLSPREVRIELEKAISNN